MADYIRFRLAAARVGVSMAFFALLAGLAERARAAEPASAPAVANFLRAVPSSAGAAPANTIHKLDSALAGLEHKLNTSFETTHKINQTFLKIKSANTEFLKIDSANTSFLKIDAANANFLKIDAANSQFLKVDSTAANSDELGGLSPQAFFQGTGNVVTGAISSLATSNTPTHLLTVPGQIVVSAVNTVGMGLQLQISNPTAETLAAVVDNGTAAPAEHDLNADATTSLTLATPTSQLHIQIFPNAGLAEVVTLVISVETSTTTLPSLVGQAFSGPS
jgi:hypothetical protein